MQWVNCGGFADGGRCRVLAAHFASQRPLQDACFDAMQSVG
eukprot:COSAG06_NODE_64888_length_258_cov_0.767296_1_plen_40_part_01